MSDPYEMLSELNALTHEKAQMELRHRAEMSAMTRKVGDCQAELTKAIHAIASRVEASIPPHANPAT